MCASNNMLEGNMMINEMHLHRHHDIMEKLQIKMVYLLSQSSNSAYAGSKYEYAVLCYMLCCCHALCDRPAQSFA